MGPKYPDLSQEDDRLGRCHRNLVDVPHTRINLSSLQVYRDVGMVRVHQIYRHLEVILIATHCLFSFILRNFLGDYPCLHSVQVDFDDCFE